MTAETARRPPSALAAWIAPHRTALLLIDMQVDFAAPEGALGGVADLSSVPAALAAAEALAAAARAAAVPLIFVGLRTSKDTDSPAWRERMRRLGADPEAESGLCRLGSPGEAFVGPRPAPGEPVVWKSRYSGFHGTDLNETLKRLRRDTLVVGGLTTECCVDSTVRDAFHLDYHVFVARDACAAYDPLFHDGALKILEANCAMLVEVETVIDVWRGETRG